MTEKHQALAVQGLTPEFLADLQNRIRTLILPKSEAYFTPGGTPDTQESSALKPGERVVNFYDYQPCAVSVLGKMAREGHDLARTLTHRILEHAEYYIGDFRTGKRRPLSLRRSLLHLALCFETLSDAMNETERHRWKAFLIRAVEDMLLHVNYFQPRTPALDNRAFATGINHIAIMAEGIYKTGQVLNRPEWMQLAGAFIDKLMAYGHPDGYFEEHTNDAREGGPSLAYTPMTAGCAYLVQVWKGNPEIEKFIRCGALHRNLLNARLQPLVFSDERANPQGIRAHRPYGRALHALTPEGRGYLRLALDPDAGFCALNGFSLEHLARLDLEIDHMQPGGGALPEPFQDGAFRIRLPLGVLRKNGWTMGLSALKALNKEMGGGDYALDRQTLVYLAHETAGVILAGAKSKNNPRWSTVCCGDDAYPVKTGRLKIDADRAEATVFYETFAVDLIWTVGPQSRLVITSNTDRPLTTQLVIEAGENARLRLNDAFEVTLGEAEFQQPDVRTIATDHWEIRAEKPGALTWPIAPFDPYSDHNASAADLNRPVWTIGWMQQIAFVFCAKNTDSQP